MRRSDLVLAWLWLKGRLRLLTRTPRTTFFTFVFPLILLLLLDSLNSSNVAVPGGKVAFAQFFTPSIASFATLTSCFTAIVVSIRVLEPSPFLPLFLAIRILLAPFSDAP